MRQATFLLLISLGGAPVVLAQASVPPAASPAPEAVPSDEALEREGAVIGDVVLRVGDVFVPAGGPLRAPRARRIRAEPAAEPLSQRGEDPARAL